MQSTTRRWALAAGLGLMLISPGRASASITQVFSQLSSDSTPTSAIPVQVTYTVTGSQLRINLEDLSTYSLTRLFFNSDTTLTGLSFAGPPLRAGRSQAPGPVKPMPATEWGITTGSSTSVPAPGGSVPVRAASSR